MDSSSDAATMKIDFLDMGKTMYGDSILVRAAGKVILIDGGHPGDYVDRNGSPGIPTQLAEILGHAAPFLVNLLVVTHCHSDHIGCLPRLVRDGILEAEWALVADEHLGFGRPDDDAPSPLDAADLPAGMRGVVAALLEESRAGASDADLAEFLQDAATLESNYQEMLGTLADRGTNIVRYNHEEDLTALVAAMQGTGLKILGPTQEHLLICAAAIEAAQHDAVAAVRDLLTDEADFDAISAYRAFAGGPVSDAADMPGTGAAKNDQSIVLSFTAGGWKALLTADMQFAKAEVPQLTPHMTDLARVVFDAGPYDLHKTAHHSSYNGIDKDVIDQFGAKTLVHTGGRDDPGHPSSAVLRLLRRERDNLTWARTDKNGRITARRSGNKIKLDIQKGNLNNAAPNRRQDVAPPPVLPVVQSQTTIPEERPPLAPPLPAVPNVVEVTAKVPHTKTRVTITIDVAPEGQPVVGEGGGGKDDDGQLPPIELGGGRKLDKLLFVTDRARLVQNLGQREAGHVISEIGRAKTSQGHRHAILERVSSEVRQAMSEVNAALRGPAKDVVGVVLVGGYDVVPAQRLDTLPASLRSRVPNADREPDQYIIWSDAAYGCIDGDDLPEIPVSRIPDGKTPQLVYRALAAGPASSAKRFGVRNFHRPFATHVFDNLAGSGSITTSELVSPQTLLGMQSALTEDELYLMLHGADFDASRFWGETAAEELYEALNLSNVPKECRSVVFTGCCWGAMPVQRRALEVATSAAAGPRTPADSLALAFLQAGAWAFVGCTGVHYSPDVPPYHFSGGPMHTHFWKHRRAGLPPAKALFEAKKDYLRGIPHLRTGSVAAIAQQEAIELKILRQFTCLGLGW